MIYYPVPVIVRTVVRQPSVPVIAILPITPPTVELPSLIMAPLRPPSGARR